MTYATWPFNLCQMGRGTAITTGGAIGSDNAIAATTVWRGVFGGFDDTRERQTTEEDVGTMASAERRSDTKIMATVPMPQTTLTYEQILHVLEASMGQVNPTGTAPGPYVYAYSVPLSTTPPTIRPYTLRVGNVLAPSDIKIVPGSWVQEWEMSGEAGSFWTVQATWQGQRGINELHVEAGHKLNGSLLKGNCVDEVLAYIAPLILGVGRGMTHMGPLQVLGDALPMAFHQVTQIGPDLRILARMRG
ncbi:MAG: bifunctional diaminohydroxyphosphoribosylaminopyrimidine [Pseudomonadota bacterium]